MRIITTLAAGFILVAVTAACGSKAATATTPSTVVSPLTETWSSNFGPKGSAARQFTASQGGTVTVTLGALTPSLDEVGLGIGVPQATDGGCTLTQAVTTVPSIDPAITATVDPGQFCVKIYDTGLTIYNEIFSIAVVHP